MSVDRKSKHYSTPKSLPVCTAGDLKPHPNGNNRN